MSTAWSSWSRTNSNTCYMTSLDSFTWSNEKTNRCVKTFWVMNSKALVPKSWSNNHAWKWEVNSVWPTKPCKVRKDIISKFQVKRFYVHLEGQIKILDSNKRTTLRSGSICRQAKSWRKLCISQLEKMD